MDTSVYLLSLLKMKEHYYIFEEQDFLKWYLTLWKTVWYFLIKINIHVPMTQQQSHCLDVSLKPAKSGVHTDLYKILMTA